jgi:hypothetical protein
MNKDIFLRNANYRIDVENWEDKKDEIIEKVKEGFREYEQVTDRKFYS